MKTVLTMALAAGLLCGCTASRSSEKDATTTADPALKPLVLDVRSPEEFNSGHVKGALNVPLDKLPEEIGKVAPDKETPIAVHCQSGGRSARAKKALDAAGYTHVTDLGSLAHARQVVEGTP